jgi:uncharacterized LabA/DUF88 family protein
MPKQIGVFIDVSNLYYCINKKYKGRKLNYKKYLEYIQGLGDVAIANAYGAQVKNQAAGFIHMLKQIGFTPKYQTPKSFTEHGQIIKKADYDVKIAVDILEAAENLDMVVLGSADSDFIPLVLKLKEKQKRVIIFACKISGDFKTIGECCVEIPESLLEKKDETLTSNSR